MNKLMKNVKESLSKFKHKLYKRIFRSNIFKVIPNKIVFDNFRGKGFGCNPKYIALELIRENIDCKMIWLVNNIDEEFPPEIKKVKYRSFKAYYHLATAKIWIDNVRNYKGIDKKSNQFYIQTWHASLGIKKVEQEVEEYLLSDYVEDAKNDGKITNLMFTNNDIMYNLFKNNFWYNGRIMKIGLPRNDILYNTSIEIKNKVYSYFRINKNKKIIIYAPTFRKKLNLEVFKFNYKLIKNELEKKFNTEYIMLIRLHPNIARFSNFIECDENFIDASKYPDMQELLAVSDIAITDYSSIAFDMSMANKKVFLFVKDYDEYINNERGLSFDFEKLPFPLAKTEEELCLCIKRFSNEKYLSDCKSFYNKIGLNDNCNSAKEIVKIIKNEMGA